MEQFHVTPVDVPQQKRSKIPFIVLGALLLIAIALVGFFAFRYSLETSKVAQLNSDKATLNSDITKLKQNAVMDRTGDQANQDAPRSTADLNAVYNRLLNQAVELSDTDQSTILEVVMKYYKVDALPEGADVLLGYQMVKQNTSPSGEIHALVYWPKTQSKTAGFVDVIKAAGSEAWRYNDML